MPVANQYGIDLPGIYGAVNALQAQRQQSQINALALEDAQQKREYRNALRSAPDDAARQGVVAMFDPALAQRMSQAAAEHGWKMADEERKAYADNVKRSADTIAAVLEVPDEQFVQFAKAAAAQNPNIKALADTVAQYGSDPKTLRAALEFQRNIGMGAAARLAQNNADRTAAQNTPQAKAEAARQVAAAERPFKLEEIAARTKAEKVPSTDTFEAKSMDANVMNILLKGDPASPAYAAAYAHASQPKNYFDPVAGQLVQVPPIDLSWARKPGAASPAQSASPAPQQSGNGVTVQTVAPPRPTDSQNLASLFADRATEAEKILATVGDQLADPVGRAKERIPFGAGNYLQSEGYQKADQARRDFVNAILRKESGAVISPEEFVNAEKQYFPSPGDSDAVKKQKAANRRTAIDGLKRMAGPGYKGGASGGFTYLGSEP